MLSTKTVFFMILTCTIDFGRLVLSNGLILHHWRLIPILRDGSTQDLALLYTFLWLVKLQLCSFIYLYRLFIFVLFHFVIIIAITHLCFLYHILNEG